MNQTDYDVMGILVRLVEGCPDHPSYRCKRAPKTCKTCIELFEAKQRLQGIFKEERAKLTPSAPTTKTITAKIGRRYVRPTFPITEE